MYEGARMTHIVTSACVDKKYQECVAVCPVEAFREADTYLVIDPDECIDCAACIPECPVEAIFADTDVPDEEEEWVAKNEDESPDLPIATGDSPVLGD
jgi:ferredoxin